MRRLLCALFGHDVIPTLGRPVGFACVRCHMRTGVR